MFGQGRPADLPWNRRQDVTNAALDIMNFLSPLKTPSVDFHLADYYKWVVDSIPATTPTSLPSDQINQYQPFQPQPNLQGEDQQQQLQHQQHAQQERQQSDVVVTSQAPGVESNRFEVPRNHQPVLTTLVQPQDVQSSQQQIQQQPLPPQQHQQFRQINQQELEQPHHVQYQLQQQQLQPTVQPQVVPHSQHIEAPVKQESVEILHRNDYENTKVKLTDEEKLRNKRERNRKAAANCRRRKDEKLKRLEDENMALRKRIESLEATIASLQKTRHD